MVDLEELWLLTVVVAVGVLFATHRYLDKDNWVTIGSNLFSVIFVVFGWWFVNVHDLQIRTAKIRADYLIQAYSDLAYGANRCPSPENNERLERTVSRVQAFGTAEERKVLQDFIDDWNRHQGAKADLNPILVLLRDEIRSELGLSPVTGTVTWLRVAGGVTDPQGCPATR